MLKFTEQEKEQAKKYIIEKIQDLHQKREKATRNEKKQAKINEELIILYNIKKLLKF